MIASAITLGTAVWANCRFMKRTAQALRFAAACTLAVSAMAAWAQPGPNAYRALGAGPDVVIKTVDTEALVGRLISFSLEDGLFFDQTDGTSRTYIKPDDVVRISTDATAGWPTPSRGGGPMLRIPESNARIVRLTLVGGDRLVGIAGRFLDEQIEFNIPSVTTLTVPLQRIATWLNAQSTERQWQSAVEALTAERTTSSDLVLLNNGDVVRGIISQVDQDGFTLETSLGLSRILQDRVVAASFVPAPLPDRDRIRAQVHFANGTRLTAHSLRWTSGPRGLLVARILDRIEREIPVDRVTHIDIIGGRWRWLTELDPDSVEQTPMLSLHWPYRKNRNVLGGMLQVGGRTFERGIGVHSRSVLTYSLKRNYRHFTTSYGIDDDSGPYADVRVEIRLDGRRVHERDSVRPGQCHGPLQFNVSGVDRLELIVDFGRHGAIQDRFDWIEPALVR